MFHALSKTGLKGVIKICTTFGTDFHNLRMNKNCSKLKTPCILKTLIISTRLHMHCCVRTNLSQALPTYIIRRVQKLSVFDI